jgi:hypothetical protein
MDLVKKNLVSIICGLIAVLAIVALFWPISGYYKQLQNTVSARKAVYTSMKGLLDRQRQLPVVELPSEGQDTPQAKPLEEFPTEAVIKVGNQLTQQISTESANILDAAIKLNQHDQFVPGVLPDGMTALAIQFRDNYKKVVDYISDDNRANSFPIQIMNAGFPPSDADVQAKKAEKEQQIKATTTYNGAGQAMNQPEIDGRLADELPKIADELKMADAKKCKVYIDYTTFQPYPAIVNGAPGVPPDPSTIFAAQVQLWIQEDVAQSVAAANAQAQNVMDAPIKHLILCDVSDVMSGSNNIQGAAAAAPADLTAALPTNFASTPTGRVSNSVYDVVPFTLKMDVDAQQVPRVLQELSRNKFVTVTNCSVQTINAALAQANGFVYGERPVVQLSLDCEELLLRKWTQPLMPQRIKAALGISDQPAAPPQ